MQIDWVTVSAQIVNFLVLVLLLQRFLYRPVLQAMDRREQRIADRLVEARRREQEAREQADDYRNRSERLERERQSLLDQYRQEAGDEKQALLRKARNDVDETRRHWQAQAAREKREFLAELRLQTAHAVAGIARKALADLADSVLEDRVINVFIRRLDSDDALVAGLCGASARLQVGTAFELDASRRDRIRQALSGRLGREVEIEFGIAPDILCGIRLGDDGHVVNWNLADYMEQLGDSMDNVVETALRQA